MDTTTRTQILVGNLSAAFAMASRCPEARGGHGESFRFRVARFLTENGRVARAIEVELADLFAGDAALGRFVDAAGSRAGRKHLAEYLFRSLCARPQVRASLLALTQGDLDAGPALDGWGPSVHRSTGWFSRNVALAVMHALILVPLAVAFLTVWRDRHSPITAPDLAGGVLTAFVVWVLSFLPSWLYIRFLGQRASALWNEYVIHLHRLAVDEPRYLPRPPRSSEFHEEWLADRGYLQEQDGNIYRQKFNAFYGRAVSSSRGADFAVKTETLFPVLLTAVIFSTCWTATLVDPGFLEDQQTVWDVMKFGFLGAYAFTVQSLIRRYFQSDLRPSAYASAILRIVVVFTTLATLYQLMGLFEGGTKAAIAFVVGAFPIVGIYALHRTAAIALRAAVPQLTPQYPLNQIDGLNVWYESRLLEEGIEDMQSLVTANLVDVVLHTRVPLGRLVDWIDQAKLYLHLDHTEVTRRERRQSTRSETGTAATGTTGWAARLGGSLGDGVRAGTRTRIELRQLGIRTATDLLVAFPPAQIDPCAHAETAARRFERLVPAGIDVEQIRLLARVLDEDADLVPVWNWHRRGARVRAPRRVPSGTRRETVFLRRPAGAAGQIDHGSRAARHDGPARRGG